MYLFLILHTFMVETLLTPNREIDFEFWDVTIPRGTCLHAANY